MLQKSWVGGLLDEMEDNQSDTHPRQINRVGTRSNSKMSFIVLKNRKGLFRFGIQKIGVFGIVLCSGSQDVVGFIVVSEDL